VQPKGDSAYIEQFYTRKGKDLYCIVPQYRQQVSLAGFKPQTGSTISILGNTKIVKGRQAGADFIIDLSMLQPSDVPQVPFVIKIKGAL
jgi:alpha-L-fucosidase